MSQDLMEYAKMMEDAVRGVMREALARTAADGLPGLLHFYITFRTTAPGVAISDHLHAQHPEEMTIVIQHRFWDLKVTDDVFEVTLTFRGVAERLRVPFEAVTAFADPAVNFGLQLKVTEGTGEEENVGLSFVAGESHQDEQAEVPNEDEPDETPDEAPEEVPEEVVEEKKSGEVIALDAFRKK